VSFADLQEAHRQLRLRLRVHAGETALGEVTVKIPVADDDELSFIRLVVWTYVLRHETGKIALSFLKELPPFTSGELLPEVGILRTWATHNLSPSKNSDKKTLQLAWAWFANTCKASIPSTSAHWKACFCKLCDQVSGVLRNAISACESLEDPEDGPSLLEELRRRLERNWEAYAFDKHVAEAAHRLGFEGVDIVEFRKRHLDFWRKVVSAADASSIERLLAQRIEADLLEFMNNALPMTSREVLERVSVADPRELGALLLAVRARARVSADELRVLLGDLADEISGTGVVSSTPSTSAVVVEGKKAAT
jgi:hypothetical protein